MAFALEAQNYNAWLEASQGYLCHPLKAYSNNPIWTADPKKQGVRRGLDPHARRRRPRPGE